MRRKTVGLAAALTLTAAMAAGVALVQPAALAPITPPTAKRFDPVEIVAGAQLAAIGNCITCHTTANGRPYAGGRPLATPFGTIYGSNITPDPETGIGYWSQAAFSRALHDGIDRDGHYLYPAFPYDHFTKMTATDTAALYAFLMTREPVRAATPAPQLPFPLNLRVLLAGWNAVFLDKAPVRPDPAHDELWNRGAYLTQALAHCGACHTPRNIVGAEERGRALAGGVADGWDAPPLDGKSPGATHWTADALTTYLRQGWTRTHGAAAGPMQEVVANLARVPETEVRAIATYVASFSGPATPVAPPAARLPQAGAAIYAATCAQCHDGTRPPPLGGIALAASTAVHAADPDDFVHIVLEGVHPDEGRAGPMMPGLAGALDDQAIATLATYLRATIGAPAWGDVEAVARRLRTKDNS